MLQTLRLISFVLGFFVRAEIMLEIHLVSADAGGVSFNRGAEVLV